MRKQIQIRGIFFYHVWLPWIDQRQLFVCLLYCAYELFCLFPFRNLTKICPKKNCDEMWKNTRPIQLDSAILFDLFAFACPRQKKNGINMTWYVWLTVMCFPTFQWPLENCYWLYKFRLICDSFPIVCHCEWPDESTPSPLRPWSDFRYCDRIKGLPKPNVEHLTEADRNIKTIQLAARHHQPNIFDTNLNNSKLHDPAAATSVRPSRRLPVTASIVPANISKRKWIEKCNKWINQRVENGNGKFAGWFDLL